MAFRLLAPVRGWEARRAVRSARRRADEEILGTVLPSPRLAWRVEELVSETNRSDLGRSLTDVVHGSDERLMPSASPLDRAAVRECRAQLLDVASRLHDSSTPITARGALLVEDLLTDGSGPLYGRNDPVRLRLAIGKVRAALDDA